MITKTIGITSGADYQTPYDAWTDNPGPLTDDYTFDIIADTLCDSTHDSGSVLMNTGGHVLRLTSSYNATIPQNPSSWYKVNCYAGYGLLVSNTGFPTGHVEVDSLLIRAVSGSGGNLLGIEDLAYSGASSLVHDCYLDGTIYHPDAGLSMHDCAKLDVYNVRISGCKFGFVGPLALGVYHDNSRRVRNVTVYGNNSGGNAIGFKLKYDGQNPRTNWV